MTKPQRCLALWAILGAASPLLLAQPERIASRIDNSRAVVLSGRVPRQATAQNDAGPVEASFPLPGITLVLKTSAAQQADLNQLLLAQQDSTSPNYHQWLTPEQYADRFGVGSGDLAKISAWLESQGFTVGYTARARNFISFTGTAQQVAMAFHTQIHHYNVNGVMHYANSTDPTIPAALDGLVSGIRGLNDFRLKPRYRKAQPLTTLLGYTAVGPTDFATIYDVSPLYSTGIDGTNQKIVIVGQSDIMTTDITAFRSKFGLGPAKLTIVPPSSLGQLGGGDPGYVMGDELESDLDIEWSGAVAKNAQIIFVAAANGVFASLQYAVDQNLAPVLSISYGDCEEYDLIDLDMERSLAQQGNAEGMTLLAASGDNAAADCDGLDNIDPAVAEGGLAVDAPGSIPEFTSMGGSEFNEGGNPGQYWTNGSATSYIPEIVWDDTVAQSQLSGGGGGASVYFTQPPWQNNLGLNDGWRHVPDLSFPASNSHDPFYIYSSDISDGSKGAQLVGGTSCAAPSMAGIVALLNQYVGAGGLGNINPTLYRLGQTPGVYHDITNALGNIVPCASGSPNCANFVDGIGTMGWPAATGYDSASGWGSVDAYNFVHAWNSAPATQAVVVASLNQTPEYETEAGSNLWSFTLTLSEEAGFSTTLTGLSINGITVTLSQVFTSGTLIPAKGSISGTYSLRDLDVSNGPVNVVFTFSFANGANTTMTAPFTGPQPQLAVNSTTQEGACQGISNAASAQVAFAPGQLISVYGTGMGSFAQGATITPLPEYMAGFEAEVYSGLDYNNYAPAPLLYVSPNQVNLQIPYETTAGSALLEVDNPYTYFQCTFTVSNTAPGIFSYSSGGASSPIGSGSTSVGQEVAIYVTGVGALRPPVVDGATPSSGGTPPTPQQAVSLTVGGVPVTNIPYSAVPSWSVGVLQINFTIPNGVSTGQQPIVVTVGGVPSLPANITITQ